MRIVVLGADGYLGWPTAMRLAAKGYEVCLVDNYLRRKLVVETDSRSLYETPLMSDKAAIYEGLSGAGMRVEVFDCTDIDPLMTLFRDFGPDAVIHYAEQPSAPYSMKGYKEADLTLRNNVFSTLNLIWACKAHAPDCHIIKLGTMGEYGTPNIDIEEGWLNVTHNRRNETFLYPRQAGSLYHTTKILDTDLLWFYVRTSNLRVTDLMQGPVYGLLTKESAIDNSLMPHFHYDDIFGTVLNRFLVQAVAGVPLTVFGKGNQTRGYLNIKDTIQCIELALAKPAQKGELRILNQFTETFTVHELADKVIEAGKCIGLKVSKKSIKNPRKELEEHYYNPKHSGLEDLGLQPNLLTEKTLVEMLEKISEFKALIDVEKILPRVRWA